MDKRWIGIIIILIAGLSAMFYITTISDSVGNAISTIDDVTITLPPGYKIDSSQHDEVTFLNTDNNHTIYIKCIGDKNLTSSALKKELKSINNKWDLEILKESDNTIQYQNVTSGENTTVMFAEKCNHTLYLKFTNFDNQKDIKKDSQFIIKNLKHDFKQLVD